MASALLRRGPDDGGVFVGDQGRLGFGFRRLAIIDLSFEGRQPMISDSGRYVIVFNGEIYNFEAIRKRLLQEGRAPAWRGSSDTEVLLAAVEAWGLKATLQRCNGMFGMGLWDNASQSLSLARDRFGEKPLYFGWCGRTFLFGSELSALAAHPDFQGDIDRESLSEFVRLGYIPAPRSIFVGIQKLPPGALMTLNQAALTAQVCPETEAYWSALEVARKSQQTPFHDGDDDAVDALDAALRDAVRARTFADVPVGAFLSGGIDSTTIVAIMQSLSSQPIRTFTIGNEDPRFDESGFAAKVAAQLGTRHETRVISARDALAIIPRLPEIYTEPFADSSQIPTLLVAETARRHVTVSLSGDGGDEFFGGYSRYLWGHKLQQFLARIPRPLRHGLGAVLSALPPERWDTALKGFNSLLPNSLQKTVTGDNLHRLSEISRNFSTIGLYDAFVSIPQRGHNPVLGAPPPSSVNDNIDFTSMARGLMYLDTRFYLPDDLLVKVDRATMGVSLEARAPFLDPEVFAFAWRLPDRMLFEPNRGKLILRRVLARYVPAALIARPKQGFAIPVGAWLRRELKDWAAALLDPRRLADEGLFDPALITKRWSDHCSSARDNQQVLWHVLMLQAWLEHWQEKRSLAAAG